jgi:hypothetical protein
MPNNASYVPSPKQSCPVLAFEQNLLIPVLAFYMHLIEPTVAAAAILKFHLLYLIKPLGLV